LALKASSDRVLTLYLSPDFKYLAPDLYNLSGDPLEELRARQQSVISQLMNKRSPEKGSEGALITIVVFSDLQCPFCKTFAKSLSALQSLDVGRDVRVVYKNFPLPMHDWSEKAASIGECAWRQNEALFWNYQDFVFANQDTLDANSLMARSTEFLGSVISSRDQIATCVGAPQTSESIAKDVELGRRLGVKSTPTFFVNGEKYEGIRSLFDLEMLVRDSLQRTGEKAAGHLKDH
jgi:protein-disulfide isomerase